ncbi:unnamed protein product [Cuscuta campestris]|uniref:Uncharacterized protein n=1 Tax=Cuscuta campestris TaxID=132261 RepID=A0A484N1X9_9ASTE|nr:unnamed protein product [Cuscuta campestris]
MGCSSSVPDRSLGQKGGLNPDNGAANDPKNLRVKLVYCWVILVLEKAALFYVLFVVNLIQHQRLLLGLPFYRRR